MTRRILLKGWLPLSLDFCWSRECGEEQESGSGAGATGCRRLKLCSGSPSHVQTVTGWESSKTDESGFRCNVVTRKWSSQHSLKCDSAALSQIRVSLRASVRPRPGILIRSSCLLSFSCSFLILHMSHSPCEIGMSLRSLPLRSPRRGRRRVHCSAAVLGQFRAAHPNHLGPHSVTM
ncbi:hypothetical protein FB567DRAFT_220044 [Paraphoma chrysanthemicola]|uniref:Secreted protein n=1 Tax=Paraphoma chrysanthemicola TaxID=798071 RepID=A0A8K0VS85_9PLEO|nr:hypothetical protein FB567DRAFT_220044 [Paraphoma chrysanthemicola]